MLKIKQLQQLLGIPLRREKSKISLAPNLLNWHHPDINLVGFSNQDNELRSLNLKDLVIEEKLAREAAAERRGKPVRVGIHGARKKAATGKGTKKKKRK